MTQAKPSSLLIVAAVALPLLAPPALSAPAAPDNATLTLADRQYVDVAGTAAQIHDGPLTVQAWFRTTSIRGSIFETGQENRDPHIRQAGYALYLGLGGKVRFGVNRSADRYEPALWDNAQTTTSYNDGNWHHATGVFVADGKTRISIYVDGKLVPESELRRSPNGAAQPPLTSYTPTDPPARIGVYTGAPPNRHHCLQGELDELRIWNVALTAEQVRANYRRQLPATTPGLVALWSFEPGPDRLADSVGGLRGTMQEVVPPPTIPLAYDYVRYPGGLTGFTGYNRDQVSKWTIKPAARQRLGKRGLHEPAVAVLANGTLVACAARVEQPDAPLQLFRSRNAGATWERLEAAGQVPSGRRPRLLRLDDETLLLRLADGTTARSEDGGQTWAAAPADWPFPAAPLADASVVKRGRERLLAAATATGALPLPDAPPPRGTPRPEADRSGDHTVLIASADGGATWSTPAPMLGYSESDGHLLRLADGRLLCTYANLHLPFGIMAVLSADDGRTWDRQQPILLARAWGPATGWPASVQLEDGSVVTVYALQAYRNEGLDTVVESVRWQLPPRTGSTRALAGISTRVTLNPEPHDRSKYPAGLYGYSGDDRQLVAYLEQWPAQRTTIGHRGLYKGALARFPDGTLVATPSFHVNVTVYRSHDRGDSWEFVDAPGLGGKEMGAVVLRDGTLLNLFGGAIYRSTDRGTSWTIHTVDAGFSFGLVRNAVENDDGSLIMAVGHGTYYDQTAPPSQAWRLVSRDGGRTWPESREIVSWGQLESMFDEAAMIRLADGRLLAAGRVTDGHQHGGVPPACGHPAPGGSEDADHMMLMESDDDGLTWSKPRDFLDYSRPHAELLQLRDGRILSCYANYTLPFGVFAVISEDNGSTWTTDSPIQIADSLSVWVGWPTSVELDDGSILTMYATTAYAGKTDQTRAETVRWRLPPRAAGP